MCREKMIDDSAAAILSFMTLELVHTLVIIFSSMNAFCLPPMLSRKWLDTSSLRDYSVGLLLVSIGRGSSDTYIGSAEISFIRIVDMREFLL